MDYTIKRDDNTFLYSLEINGTEIANGLTLSEAVTMFETMITSDFFKGE